MSAVPALRKVREEPGTLDGGKTNKLKVGPPAVDKSQSIEKPHPFDFAQGRLSRQKREKWGTLEF